MPTDRERLQRLSALLDVALEMDDTGRTTWLSALHDAEPDVATELVAMLRAEPRMQGRHILDTPVWNAVVDPATGPTGQRIGAYTLDSPIGRGGMGSVWRAHRSDGRFDGTVAVKFVNLALLDAAGIARFQREGTLLGRLSHPNIARLLDAGVTDSGQPYLVLEYVDGVAIDEYCNSRRLSPADRIRLVLDVLASVSHAHANLIVHRDLKPSNILVTADGTVKLLDFGIAKLLHDEADVAGAETLTQDGGRLLTPDFAAPEQVTGDAITTATDVYALGVLLYVLLSGRHPTRVGKSGSDALQGILNTEPPRLSAAVTGGSDISRVAEERRASPEKLRRYYRGDLGNILARALRKAPAERYASAVAFADDLQRFLRHEPVSARPDSFGYRAWKFVRRNRVRVAVASAAALALLTAGVRERQLRARAEAESQRAVAVEQYLVSIFGAADPYAVKTDTGNVSARTLLDRGVARVDTAFSQQPAVRAQLRMALGRVYANLGVMDQAIAQIGKALTERRTIFGARHVAVADAMNELGRLYTVTSQFGQADSLLRGALAQRQALFGVQSAEAAETLDNLAQLAFEQDKPAEAEGFARAALRARDALGTRDALDGARTAINLAKVLEREEKFAEADTLVRQALATRERLLGADHPVTSEAAMQAANIAKSIGQTKVSETLYRRVLASRIKVLGPEHPDVATAANDLGDLLRTVRPDDPEAEALFRRGLAINRRVYGENHANVATSLANVATFLRENGRFAEAKGMLLQALAIDRTLYPGDHENVAFDLNEIASVLRSEDRPDSAVVLLREALAMSTRAHGATHRNTLAVQAHLGKALREAGKYREAEVQLRASITALDHANPELRFLWLPSLPHLGRTLTATGRATEAIPILEEAVAELTKDPGPTNWRTADARTALGEALTVLKRYDAAERHLLDAYAIIDKVRDDQPHLPPQVELALRTLYTAMGQPAKAKKYARRS